MLVSQCCPGAEAAKIDRVVEPGIAMIETASQFVGSIPEYYDRGLASNVFDDFARDLVRRVDTFGAASVLELAAGTGIVSRRLRDALPIAVRLVLTDLNASMLEIARQKFRDGETVEFKTADALELPFAEAEFDLIVCQLGVMFFPDKVAAFREALRVVSPNGRYVFNTMGPLAANPFTQCAFDAVARFFPDKPPNFYKTPHSYSDPEVVTADLQAAGWANVRYEIIALQKAISDLPGLAKGLVLGNPVIHEIRQQGIDANDVVNSVISELEGHFGPAPFTMPLEANVFAAQRI